mmetsp:Transcript_21817/g.37244  ORF Transcript_21817/g.37244 Transcript_21817/m.37244 type:complete len:89 (-) Transcript_21817:364-630(-)|eukprot:CAMPEP_0119107000 /NCGR_PEP_ID=MMETSP1180-20130426/7893_1 /TAXON_ID=3052 ORGANISM="Chlamydomonas cf sp, Strain CCMP681" /NCGR_SAMPLE_ID=MMETSP1180 /ASSEMBLY_ACC=CAM_ASM_000741 /LENGTH=88 /DNA_ID=CAMNT_0007092421 /DNA_START=77 /DNA_END=343 /DNA_ORIENTATION=+
MSSAAANTALGPRAAKPAGAAPAGGLARRRPGGARSDGPSSSGRKTQTQNYYTDDTPGIKISPVVVIGMSLGFIFFVTILHVVAKIRG